MPRLYPAVIGNDDYQPVLAVITRAAVYRLQQFVTHGVLVAEALYIFVIVVAEARAVSVMVRPLVYTEDDVALVFSALPTADQGSFRSGFRRRSQTPVFAVALRS